jgi:hypothetical protein
MTLQEAFMIDIGRYRKPQATHGAMDGLAYFVQKLKARTSGHMKIDDLEAAFKLAQELEQKAKDIRKAIREDINKLKEQS